MTALSTTHPCWPPPPPGHAALARVRIPGRVLVENAPLVQEDEAEFGRKSRWFGHPLMTVFAFLIFPPLGLWMAIRYHGLWRQRVAVRVFTLALTIAFMVIPLVTNPSDGGGTGIQDGAPIVSAFDSGPALDPGETDPTLGV